MSAPDDALRRFAAADLTGWRGLPADLALPTGDGAVGDGALGDERRSATWISAESEAWEGGLRIWHDDGSVLALEGHDPVDAAGAPLAAPELGEPDTVLDTFLGRLPLARGELVYAALGLALRVNPENGLLLGAVGFAPTTVEEYRARLRPSVAPPRRLPNQLGCGSEQ
jgi:hypothetical protein